MPICRAVCLYLACKDGTIPSFFAACSTGHEKVRSGSAGHKKSALLSGKALLVWHENLFLQSVTNFSTLN